MEGKDSVYLQPHTPSYQLITAPTEEASSPGRNLSHYPTVSTQQSSPRIQNTATAVQGQGHKPTDSAYNSEHEHSPEQQEGNKEKQDMSIDARPAQTDLWKSFSKVGNEMIVTKPGR
jgi:hypothetical protein